MSKINKNINDNLQNIFIIGLLLFALIFIITNFYTYYQNKTAYEYADWLINYQGGFVRRGLIGEFLFQIYKITKINLGFLSSFIKDTYLEFELFSNRYRIYNYIIPEIEKKLGMEPSKPKEIKVEEYNKKTGNKIFEDIILK